MTQTAQNDPWIAYRQPRPQARLRLFCLPFAGGGALTYRPWTAEMPDEIEVLPVQLPGRERRLGEESFLRMGPLVDALDAALVPYLDLPFAIFGHSMGTRIGYELAQRWRRDRGIEPSSLMVSAGRSPTLPPDPDNYFQLPDAELQDKLREIEGTPPEVLEHPELMELLLPLIRADFELNDTYEAGDYPPLSCRVLSMGGIDDPEVGREELEAWRQITTGRFRLRMFPGHHFFLHEVRKELITTLAEELLR